MSNTLIHEMKISDPSVHSLQPVSVSPLEYPIFAPYCRPVGSIFVRSKQGLREYRYNHLIYSL